MEVPQDLRPDSNSARIKKLDSSGYLSNKTIIALTTPPGGALCGLRLSGSKALDIALKITGLSFLELQEKRAKRVWIRDGEKKIDDAVLIPYFEPRSFTGENVVEFFIHGSPIIAQKVMELAFKEDARLALPGEFSFRAVKNGKIKLSQAEAVKELIQAENDFALDLALEKLSGSQHALIEKIRTDLMQLATLSEVAIDFSDQDIDEVSLPRLKERLKELIHILKGLQGSFDRGKRFQDGVPVSLFGLPNAGKSSFFNSLLGEDRSIVSDVAGTTRDVVRERINLKGINGSVTFKLSDTAGIRGLDSDSGHDGIEKIGIERSLQAARSSDLVILVLDGIFPEFSILENFLKQIGDREIIGVITKKDCLNFDQQKDLLDQAVQNLPQVKGWTLISSQTLEGIHEVALKMTDFAEKLLMRAPGEVVITQIEHLQAIEGSLRCLNEAMDSQDVVLFATTIRHGMGELGTLIGETVTDDILGKIFSDFCIGK